MAIILALVGAVLIGVGAAMQKHGMASKFPKISLKQFLSQWGKVIKTLGTNIVWLGGIIVGMVGGAIQTQAIAEGDLTLIQPIFNTTNLWSILAGVLVLSERLSRLEWIGVLTMFAGALVVSMGSDKATAGDPDMVAMVIVIVIVAVLMVIAYMINKKASRGVSVEFILAGGSGLVFGLANISMKLMSWDVATHVGKFNITSGETWGRMVANYPFYTIIVWGILAMVFLHGAFSHGRVAMVTPMVTVFTTFLVIACAIWVFDERIELIRGLGIGVSILGTLMLAHEARKAPPEQGTK